jgi:hypothetical protein
MKSLAESLNLNHSLRFLNLSVRIHIIYHHHRHHHHNLES